MSDPRPEVAGMLAAFALYAAGTSLPRSASDYRADDPT